VILGLEESASGLSAKMVTVHLALGHSWGLAAFL
jgi:hypothetical protein